MGGFFEARECGILEDYKKYRSRKQGFSGRFGHALQVETVKMGFDAPVLLPYNLPLLLFGTVQVGEVVIYESIFGIVIKFHKK